MQAVSRVPVVQQTVEQLKHYIFSGELAVGQKLPSEKNLCAQLDIGRGSLREALRVLAANGYINLLPGRGAFVVRITEYDSENDVIGWFTTHEVETQDYLEVRSVVEPLATRLAISNCTKEDYKKLEGIHNRYVQAVSKGDTQQILLEEGNFHDTIIQLSKNNLLINIFKLMRQPMVEFRRRSLQLPNAPEDAVKPHLRILHAFELRDPEYGEACMREHVKFGIENLSRSKQNYSITAQQNEAVQPHDDHAAQNFDPDKKGFNE